MLLGLDIGTTHCKAGLFTPDGTLLGLAKRPMSTRHHPTGYAYYEPEVLWQTAVGAICAAIGEVVASSGGKAITAVGVASMAETGLLLNRQTGVPCTPFLPWFDMSAAEPATLLNQTGTAYERFIRTGIYPSFKCSLAKLLWLQVRDAAVLNGAIWLSVADYVVYRLTGEIATDYSLAGRTYAFSLTQADWDAEWLAQFGLSLALFPHPVAAGTLIGTVRPSAQAETGLPVGTAVTIAGHDHVCAAFAAGAVEPGQVFDSMGTAETLIGALPQNLLGEAEFASGLTFGRHVVGGRHYWLGGLSMSGGSIEWLRAILGDPPMTYDEITCLLPEAPVEPGDLLYFPYLAGSSSPWPNPDVRGAFIGLGQTHGRAHLLQAILEGTAYQIEAIRRAAEQVTGSAIKQIVAAGGGTHNRTWLQIKADITGCEHVLLASAEATLLGAALLAGICGGLFANEREALAAVSRPPQATIPPRPQIHERYREVYEQQFLAWQTPLRKSYRIQK